MRTMRPIVLKTKFRTEYGNGINIAGYINNGAKSTVIIAAHYDHKGSKTINGKREIFPGANDNASGVTAMLALASKIRQAQFSKYNYLFMAFSAEEEGALGSKAFIEERDFKGKSIAYMINLDELGNLTSGRNITVAGLGTAPEFKGMIQNIPGNFKVRKQNLGTSESDHLTFYNINIPFLYITTEEDPVSGTIGDIATRLNYKGLADLTMYTFNIVSAMEKLPMPVFTKTKDEAVVEPTPLIVADTAPAVKSALAKESKAKAQKENAKPTTVKNPKNPTVPNTKNDKALPTIAQASKDNNSNKEKAKATIQQMQQTTSTQDQPVYKVSLGISPDLSYTEGGVRIATVSAGRAAANAGIQNGDVIVQMRDMPIQNYDNYLEALAKFSKGQKTIIKVKRNGRLQSYPVVFQ
jgi:hypothetical protein